MAKKNDIKKKIEESEQEISRLESKLMRSQIAVMGAILNNEPPNEEDREYFRVYSKLIEVERNNLRELYKQLEQ